MMNKNKKAYLILFLLFAFLLLLIEIFNARHHVDSLKYELAYGTLTRIFGAAICLLLLKYSGFNYLLSFKGFKVQSLLIVLPCFLISINNFPFLPVFSGDVVFDAKWYYVMLYALQCFFVGLFEETAFRGCVFMLMLEKKHETRKDIFFAVILSSLVFGAIHIVNLLAGAGIVPVVLQLGYSFLIGSMCAVILLVTKSLWVAVLTHAVFNFAGGVMPTFINGFKIWTIGEVILTVVVSVAVAVYTVLLFFKIDLSKLQSILHTNKN